MPEIDPRPESGIDKVQSGEQSGDVAELDAAPPDRSSSDAIPAPDRPSDVDVMIPASVTASAPADAGAGVSDDSDAAANNTIAGGESDVAAVAAPTSEEEIAAPTLADGITAIDLPDPITDLQQVVPRGRFAEYVIRKEIGHGSMSRVMAAVHPAASMTAAIKLLDPKQVARHPEAVARFEREARAIRKLDHPNIVSIYEIDCFHGVHYIAMEHIRGKNLQHILGRSEKRLFTPRLAATIILRVASALKFAYEHGVVHRDVKLDNIMIDGQKTVKVLDFGCALDTSEDGDRVSREMTVIGSPNYMSPEQCRGLKVDFRTDIYALGICFYFMVTGRFPFIARDTVALIRKQVFDQPKPPSDVNPGIPADVEMVILRMLAKQPTERQRSYDELIMQLERIAEGSPADLPVDVPDLEIVEPDRVTSSSQVILLANREVEEILAMEALNTAMAVSADQWSVPTDLEVVSGPAPSPPVVAPPPVVLAPPPPVVSHGEPPPVPGSGSIRAPQVVEGRRPKRTSSQTSGLRPPDGSTRPPARRTDRVQSDRPPARRSGRVRPEDDAPRVGPPPPARRSGRIVPDDEDGGDDPGSSGSGSGRMLPPDTEGSGPRMPSPRRRPPRRRR